MSDQDFDLDEDLFDFEEIVDTSSDEAEKIDLEELLKVLEDKPEPLPMTIEGDAPPEAEESEVIGVEEPAAPEPVDEPPPVKPVEVPQATPVASAAPAAAPAQAPATVVTVPASPVSRRFVQLAILCVVGIALLNVVSMGLSWERNREISGALVEMEERFSRTAGDLRQELFHQSSAMERSRMPIVAPEGRGAESLELAESLLDEGRHQEAREHLYSVMSVVDRYDGDTARILESRTAYLLAESWRREAETVAKEGRFLKP